MKWSIVICIFNLGLCLAVLEPNCNGLSGLGTLEKLKVTTKKLQECIEELDEPESEKNTEARKNQSLAKIFGESGSSIVNTRACLQYYVKITNLCISELNNCYKSFLESRFDESSKFMITDISCKNYEKYENCVAQEMKDYSSDPSFIFIEGLLHFTKSSYCSDNKIIRSRRSLRRIVRDVGGMGSHLSHIEHAVKNGCVKYGEPLGKLDESLEKAKNCVKNKTMFVTPEKEFIAHLDFCTKDTIKVFEKCLPEKLKYFPKFLFNLIDSLVKLLYKDFVIIGEALGQCVDKLKSTESETKYHQCINDAGGEQEDDIPSSKEKFCKKFLPVSQCFVTQINETCTHSDSLSTFSKDYMRAMREPCGQ